MKKGWKIFWIVCASCLGVGIVCCVVSLIMGVTIEGIENRFPNGITLGRGIGIFMYDDDYEEGNAVAESDDRQSFSGVRSIDIDVWAGEVEIRTLPDTYQEHHQEHYRQEVIVETQGVSRKMRLQYYMDGDELKIKTKKKLVGIKNGAGKIYVYVPQDYLFEEVSLDVGAGTLYVENIRAEEFSVDIGAGEAVIDSFTADEVDLDCGAGEITAAGNAVREVDIDCGMGEITFTASGKQSDYDYKISCGIGQVVCGDMSCSGIGSERKVSNGTFREMNVDCGVGEVTIHFSEGI